MIKLGYFQHGGYPDGGFMYENNGGEIVFKGAITFGGNSSFSIGKYGRLEIGDSTGSIEGFKVVCYHHIQIQNNCRIGWDVLMMDTSFHPLKNMDGTYTGTGVAPIIIGHDSWISTRCLVCPGAAMAPHSVLAANSMLNKSFDESYVLLAGSPATIKRRGIYRDMSDDRIDFEKYSILGK
jgi:acetyltransferase-like isoleucine patch superfamily enzyme